MWYVFGTVLVDGQVKIKNTIRCRKQIEAHKVKPGLKHSGYGFGGEKVDWS